MCGIGVCACIRSAPHSSGGSCSLTPGTQTLLKRRGPDGSTLEEVKVDDDAVLTFFSAVLNLRGKGLTTQPLRDEFGNVLAWNGEIYGGIQVLEKDCDTTQLLKALSQANTTEDLLKVFAAIYGPWSMVYFKRSERQLWFGRDFLGRRSLLFHCTQTCLSLSSSIEPSSETWEELPANGVYCLDLSASSRKGHLVFNFYPWNHKPSGQTFKNDEWKPTCLHENLMAHTLNSRINTCLNKKVKEDEMSQLPPLTHSFFQKLLEDAQFRTLVQEFSNVLSESVRVRVLSNNLICRDCVSKHWYNPKDVNCSHASVGVLFSGGIDSMVLAAYCAKHLPGKVPIDLLNVSFKHQIHFIDSCTKKRNLFTTFQSPDRLTGVQGAEELRRVFPDRKWNFVEINITKEELQKERTSHIKKLIYPLNTVLDDSLGCALWFAARGKGIITEGPREVEYESPSRVVILGMGADEQLGGYSRHVLKFKNLGWHGLLEEMEMEIDRISSRNLGRDDRVVSDHGREPRFPFLDRNVINFLNGIPIWMKVNPHLARGFGDKLLLRLLAFSLHLEEAACRPKRAMQFGSRIVLAEEDRSKGSDISEKLKQMDLGSVPESEMQFWKTG